jgi:hypothetical protein
MRSVIANGRKRVVKPGKKLNKGDYFCVYVKEHKRHARYACKFVNEKGKLVFAQKSICKCGSN